MPISYIRSPWTELEIGTLLDAFEIQPVIILIIFLVIEKILRGKMLIA